MAAVRGFLGANPVNTVRDAVAGTVTAACIGRSKQIQNTIGLGERMETKSYRLIRYKMDGDRLDDRRTALCLFDELHFRSNIVLTALRAYTDSDEAVWAFADRYHGRMVRDRARPDAFDIVIPDLQSNLILFGLIAIMDVQTEWTYVPQVDRIEEFLVGRSFLHAKDSVACVYSSFEARFDEVFGLRFFFDTEFFTRDEIDRTLRSWETLLEGRHFTKTEKEKRITIPHR